MTDSSLPANVQLGFLTIAAEGAGMVGGLLVTNCWGRPLEFRLSTAVQPTRVQQILYGPTLHEYLTADLIGKTLLDKSSTGVHLLIVDAPPLLGIRSRLEYPAIALGGEGFDESKHFLLDHARCTKPLAVPLSHEAADRDRILALLERVDPGLDLVEPFTRIREAMGEARRLGGATRAAA